MTLLEYYKKQLGNEVYQIDGFYINVNMIPDTRFRATLDKALSARIETGDEMPVIDDDFSYFDDLFDVVRFENGEVRFYPTVTGWENVSNADSFEQDVEIEKWLKYGRFTYNVGDREI